jgi:predicted nucleic acid-binding protein
MLVDTNIVLDILTDDPNWAEWSADQLIAGAAGPLWINMIIYAELAGSHPTHDALRRSIDALGLDLVDVPREGLYLAGQAYRQYRKDGGSKSRVLADFIIGAHAVAADVPLLTRNGRDFRHRFPAIQLITPP